MTFDFIKCEECKYDDNCPVFHSYLNAACATIQKPKETTILYDIIDKIFCREGQEKEDIRE